MSPDPASDDCIFCRIASGNAAAADVYRDDRVTAFLDHNPVTPGHLLVIPNEHLASFDEVPEGLASHLFVVGQSLARALRASGLPCDGINLFLADGEAAFQEVFHVHLHVVARTPGDGFTISSPAWEQAKPSLDDLMANAAAIRTALA